MKYILLILILSLTACKKSAEPQESPLSEENIALLAQQSLTEFSPGYYEHIASARLSDDKKKVLLFFNEEILGKKEVVLEYDGFRRYVGRVTNGFSSVGPIVVDLGEK